ncbi:MAG TPA: DUF6702 family protein [Draconibacterium sp.]|nr:DUF6702 family protein [Draconibacterium sp.]
MKIIKKVILPLVFLFFGVFSLQAHPFYVSICQVDFNPEHQSLEISVKIFADDLLAALAEEGKEKLFLGEPKENEHADEYIFSYLQRELTFKVNDKTVHPNFVGKEMEKDVIWTYLEISDVAALHKINVFCSMLTEVFNDQQNIIQVNKNGEIKNLLLSKKQTSGELMFPEN